MQKLEGSYRVCGLIQQSKHPFRSHTCNKLIRCDFDTKLIVSFYEIIHLEYIESYANLSVVDNVTDTTNMMN